MTTITVSGGDSTSTGRTATIYFAESAVLKEFSIPVKLNDSTTLTKKVTIDVTINGIVYTTVKQFEKGDTGTVYIVITLGYEISETSSITLKFSGSRATINFGTYEYPVSCLNGVSVTKNAFNFIISYDTSKVWKIDSDEDGDGHVINEGYPWRINEPDASVFSGYPDPKPLNSWKIDSDEDGDGHVINEGYPYIWGDTELSSGGKQNIFLKTSTGLSSLAPYLKTENGIVPLTFIKLKGG